MQGLSLSGVRAFVNCSEPVRDASQRQFLERFAPIGVRPEQLAASYAMAENVFAVTQTPIGRPPRIDRADDGGTHVSCGPPIAGVHVRIEGGRPDGRAGEIQVRSDSMLSGYHGRPDLDAGLFDGGWYRTGDLGYLRDGELYVIGRKKDLIIVAGKNLHPHDLEAAVNSVAGVHPGRAVVFGVTDEAEGTELVAVVAEVESEDAATRKAIGGAIRRALVAQAGVVASFVHLVGPKWLLKTSSGKIARAANREKWLAERRAEPSEGRIGKEVDPMEEGARKVAPRSGTAPKPPGTRSARGSSKKGAGVKGRTGKGGVTGAGKKKAARKPATNRTTKGAVKAGATDKPMKPVSLKGKGRKAAGRG
jgi:acyl-CoA synthetase (AMP-forming)/AMP-acid ligase II